MLALQAALDILQTAEQKVEKTARRLAGLASDTGGPADTISLSDEMIGLMEARSTAGAAASVIHSEQEMERHIIDVLG